MSRNTRPTPKSSRRALLPFALMGGLAAGLALALAAWTVSASMNANPALGTLEVRGAPHLAVDQDTIDLGDVKLGQTVQASFKLRNTGDQAVRITEKPVVAVLEGC